MNKDELDFYYWPMDISNPNQTDYRSFGLSKVASTAPVNVGQILRKPNKLNKLDFSSFLIENIGLLVLTFIGYFFSLMVIFILLKLFKRRCSLYCLLNFDRSRLSSMPFKICILFLAISLFLFFTLSILTNMIKTEKVTVSTSEFIDSISKLNKTTKTLIIRLPRFKKLFNRLSKKTKHNDVLCIYDYNNYNKYDNFNYIYSKISKNGFNSFFLMEEIYFFSLAYHFTLLNRLVDHFLFIKPTIYFEALRAIYYRKNLDKKMKQILNRR